MRSWARSLNMDLTITQPDDWHLHLRDGRAMADVVGATAAVFGRAVVMPNLRPPVTSVDQALEYRGRILDALPAGSGFEPLMTLYLTDLTPPEEVPRARDAGIVGFKLYPAGATTNSDAGVTDFDRVAPTIEAMEEHGLVLLVHGEVTDPEVDIFDREKCFIDRVLGPLLRRHEGLKVVFEHVTTKDAVDFVQSSPPRVGCDHHPAAPAAQSKRHPGRRSQTAQLLSAGAQARDPPPGVGGGRHRRRPEVLSRHRQRAARAVDQGKPLRVRGVLHRSTRPWRSTPRRSRPPAPSIGSRRSPPSTAPISTVCRETAPRHSGQGTVDRSRGLPLRRRRCRTLEGR